MKVIFEYEDGTYRIVPFVSVVDIEEKTVKNRLLDQYICDSDLKNKYIVADINKLSGFGGHKDVERITKEIKELEDSINLKKLALDFYKGYEDLNLANEKEDIFTEHKAVEELFKYVIEREKHVLHTNKS